MLTRSSFCIRTAVLRVRSFSTNTSEAQSTSSTSSPSSVSSSSSSFVPTPLRPYHWLRDESIPVTQLFPSLKPIKPTIHSVRSGILGKKVGMMHIYDSWGRRIPVTVIDASDCTVFAVSNTPSPKTGHITMTLGLGRKKPKNALKSELGLARIARTYPPEHMASFTVSPDALLPVGFPMSVRHFVPGQYVDVQGTTSGKGFQGAMKRWGFKGQPATHGVSVTHRSIGSTGANQTPGRVFPGRKMPGHMGCKTKTIQNLQVVRIDTKKNLLFIKGAVPGKPNLLVRVKDAVKLRLKNYGLNEQDGTVPFPTYIPQPNESLPDIVDAPPGQADPFAYMSD